MEQKKTVTKVALITGSARRIGAAIARKLHEAHYNVVLHYRSSRFDAESLCADLNNTRDHSAVAVPADLRETAKLNLFVEQVLKEWGRLDVLVNNASCFIKTPLGDIKERVYEEIMDSNLKAPLFLSQLVTPFLKASQGCIVNITDIHIETPLREYSVYCLSKAGLMSLTKVMAKELGPEVRVNAISPGMMILPEGDNELSEAVKNKIIQEAALKRMGSPEDIAKAVLFFVKDADYVTGQVLAVDGGRLL